MNKLLVVVPYKLWFLPTGGLLSLQVHEGIVVIKFNHVGCGVGGILVNDRQI